MRKALLILLLSSPCLAGNLDTFWFNDGSYKLARQDTYPDNSKSTSTYSTNWNGNTASTFGGRNEEVSLVLYMKAGASDATEVNVRMSSFTLRGGGDSIVSVVRSSWNVYDYQNQPIEQFYVRYLQLKGISQLGADPTEYEARHYPVRFRRPYTVNGADQGVVSGNWTNRPDHDKFYPEILVPYEAIAASSFTVAASSSQAIWWDFYIEKNKTPGIYDGRVSVYEGVTLSTAFPVVLTVKGFTLPDSPNFKTVVYLGKNDIAWRHQAERFPGEGAPYEATRLKYRQFLRRHKIDSIVGSELTTQDYPTGEYISQLNGSLFSNASGYYGIGVDVPASYYSIATYGGWASAWDGGAAATNTALFCAHIDAWATWFRDHSPTTKTWLYLTDEPADLTNTNKWSTWMSTSCAQTATYKVKAMVTAAHVATNSGAPYVQYPVSTTYIQASSSTIETTVSSYTTNQGGAIFYNTATPWTGWGVTEADGYEMREVAWGAYKKGVMNWYLWESTYWNGGTNNGYCRDPDDNDIWNDAQTFGCTDTLHYDTNKGMTDYQFSNGEGVLMYPGTDLYDTANNYGLAGPIASIRLKNWRRGVQDADYLAMAYAADPSAATTALNAIVGGRVMWEYQCYDPGDCTYAVGARGFSENFADYETQRLALADLIPADDGGTTPATYPTIFGGGMLFR